MDTKAPSAEEEFFLPSPVTQFLCEASYYSGAFHSVIYACAFEFSIFLFLPSTAPGLFFKMCRAEGSRSFAFGLPLVLTQTYGCLPNDQEASDEELCPREKQAIRTSSLSKPINCWSKRQTLKWSGVGWLPLCHHAGCSCHRAGTILTKVWLSFSSKDKKQLIAQVLFQIFLILK